MKIRLLVGILSAALLLGLFSIVRSYHHYSRPEEIRRMIDAHRDKRNNTEKELFKDVFMSIHQEAVACDRLNLPKEEKERRVSAVEAAAQAEVLKVRASHYTLPYQSPPTD